MFNDTSRYLDDIFTIDKPWFEKHIPDIHVYIQQNFSWTKHLYFRQRSFFPGLKYKINTSAYDKRDDFWFPIVNFPWLSGVFPRLPSLGMYISQLVSFATYRTSVLDFHYKAVQNKKRLSKKSTFCDDMLFTHRFQRNITS